MGEGDAWPSVDRSYRLEQIVETYRYVGTGRKTISVILEVDPAAL